jgi:sortase A
MDRILLVVEVLAVVGLVGVLISGFGLLRDLNEEVAAALVQETFTPTPLVMAVVLPSGHTPPDAQGNTRPNIEEIPEHLQPMVQSMANLPVPTPAPDQAIRIQIPSLDVDAPVVQGDGWEQLKKGVGQNIGSANPGQNGNVVLSAHNDVYGAWRSGDLIHTTAAVHLCCRPDIHRRAHRGGGHGADRQPNSDFDFLLSLSRE